MKLKILTLDRRVFNVEFSDKKTVWELKKHICRVRGMWSHPDNQRLLYAGQELDDHRQLRSYCIDERKYLLMLTKKVPPQLHHQLRKSSSSTLELESSKTSTTTTTQTENSNKPRNVCQPMYIPTDIVKEHIMKLGKWNETEVRRALLISLNNPNRAIEYLTNGKKLFPIMITPPSSRLFLSQSNQNLRNKTMKPQSPELLSDSDDDSDFDFEESLSNVHLTMSKEKIVRWNISSRTSLDLRNSLHDIQRLVKIGFPQDIVVEAYRACDKNIEQTAALLFEQYIEDNDTGH